MSAWYWLLWAVLTVVNFAAFYYWSRRFTGFAGFVIYKGRTYRIIEQSWELDSDVMTIRGETR